MRKEGWVWCVGLLERVWNVSRGCDCGSWSWRVGSPWLFTAGSTVILALPECSCSGVDAEGDKVPQACTACLFAPKERVKEGYVMDSSA